MDTVQFIRYVHLCSNMVVNDDRKRYISFIIKNGKTDRKRMIGAIRNEFTKKEYDEIKPWLTVFEQDQGIVRCKHTGKERAVEILNRIKINDGEVETIITSGTIKKAKKALRDMNG